MSARLLRHGLRGVVTVGATTAALLATAGLASAHECYVANRSAQGNAQAAAHSQVWQAEFTLEQLYASPCVAWMGTGGQVSLSQLSPEQQAAAVTAAEQAGYPDLFVVGGGSPFTDGLNPDGRYVSQAGGQGGTIAENNPNMASGLAADGTGIDHLEESSQGLIGIYLGVGGSFVDPAQTEALCGPADGPPEG